MKRGKHQGEVKRTVVQHYSGVEIVLDADGKFTATIGGDVKLSNDRLDGIKVAIDNTQKAPTMVKRKVSLPVVGILKSESRWAGEDVTKTSAEEKSEREFVKEAYGRIDPDAYDGVIRRLETKHKQQMMKAKRSSKTKRVK